jgi:predicted CxxxxCH...CXXCH cytochrome family protein
LIHRLSSACALLLALTACGGDSPSPSPAARAPAARAPAARTAATSSTSHDLYAQNGIRCEACHACGVKSPDGHAASWMDPASTDFHATSANRGLAACQSCHGQALDGVGGTAEVSCASCHGAEWKTDCTMCHGGTEDATGAPPKATWARLTDPVAVGAHRSHVAPNPVGAVSTCAECHPVPADVFSAGHVDGTVAVRFAGPVSGLKGGTWNGAATPTCSSTYCHGNFIAGKKTNAPSWTGTNQAACGTCHNARPLGYLHKRHQDTNFNDPTIPWWKGWITCDQCHDGIAKSTTRNDAPTMILVNGAASPVHVDGTKTVVFKNGGTWTAAPFEGTCSGMQCHPGEEKMWPR